jgi:hypothetical protein
MSPPEAAAALIASSRGRLSRSESPVVLHITWTCTDLTIDTPFTRAVTSMVPDEEGA